MAQDHFERHDHHEGTLEWNFNVIFSDQPSVAVMADAYRPLLTRPEFYEPIPTQWLHATILAVGSVDQYTESEMLLVAQKVQARLQNTEFPEFHFSPPVQIYGNVCFKIEPEAALEKLYSAVTESLEEVVGPDRATKSPYGHFIAHTSFVYSRVRENEAETEIILQQADIKPATFRIAHMPLIKQRPTNGHYEWEIVKDILIDSPT